MLVFIHLIDFEITLKYFFIKNQNENELHRKIRRIIRCHNKRVIFL